MDSRKLRDLIFADISDPADLRRAVDSAVDAFARLEAPNCDKNVDAMMGIGLIKLCRKAAQPNRISEIWPHITAACGTCSRDMAGRAPPSTPSKLYQPRRSAKHRRGGSSSSG